MRYRKTNYALATFTLRDGKITITFPLADEAIPETTAKCD